MGGEVKTENAVQEKSLAFAVRIVNLYKHLAKETRETIYWLRLFKATGYLSQEEFDGIMSDAEELHRIITAIQLGLKRNAVHNS